jgi:hypothetical protein
LRKSLEAESQFLEEERRRLLEESDEQPVEEVSPEPLDAAEEETRRLDLEKTITQARAYLA